MRKSFGKMLSAAAGAALLMAGASAPAKAETELTLVYPFPDFLVYTQSCIALAESLNEAGEGHFSVDVRPFNSIGMFEQATAIQRGTVDLSCLPAAFYARSLPENEAISTSNSSPEAVRANGGMAIIDQLHQERVNMKYLGWVDSGVRFHIYLKDAPSFRDDGMPDFSDVQMRDNPIYGAFFRALDAETHQMPVTDVYSAIQTGVVNASAWTSIGITGLRWNEFLTHRLDPDFYQTDIGFIMNLDSWNNLSAEAQQILQDAVIAHENSSRAQRMNEVVAEKAALEEAGMQVHEVPEGEAYRQLAVDSAYDRMMQRLNDDGTSTEHADQLRGLYLQ